MRATPKARTACGLTMVELLVVIAVLTMLMGLLLPAIRQVREHSGEAACAANLRQLGVAALAYLAAWDDHLPQAAAVNDYTGEVQIIGALFGGKRGQLAAFGINEIGADRRPLNRYLSTTTLRSDDDGDDFIDEHVPVFECPLDRGQPGDGAFLPHTNSMYDFIGTSYTLNDHALDGEGCWTLVPGRTPPCDPDPDAAGDQKPGGRMPRVEDPTRTWMIGDLPIYNYQADGPSGEIGDRRQRWHFHKVQVNLAFVDGHVGSAIRVPPSTDGDGDGHIDEQTTASYTFLPHRDWLEPVWRQRYCNGCGK
ncbi:MAG: hypothetical protein ACYS0G_08410 [Planctomycetota bacterium]